MFYGNHPPPGSAQQLPLSRVVNLILFGVHVFLFESCYETQVREKSVHKNGGASQVEAFGVFSDGGLDNAARSGKGI